MPAHPLKGVAYLQDRVLALAQEHRVEAVGDRLRIEHARATGDDERVGVRPLLGQQRHAAQVEHVQQVRVCQFVAQTDAQDIEVAQGSPGLQAPQRQISKPQLGLEVDIGCEAAFGQSVGSIVDDFVQDPEAEVAHPDLVQVRIGEAPLQRDGGPILLDRVPLAAGVAAGFADATQRPLQGKRREHRRSVVRPTRVGTG